MKLPKLFGRKKNDDEDEDDLDDEMLDLEDLDDHVDDEDSDHPDEELARAGYDPDEVADDVMVGGDDELHDPFEGTDDEFDDEDEAAEESSAKRKAIMFAAVGAGVLLLSGLGGAAYWLFSGEDAQHAEAPAANDDPRQVELSMPPPPGSLNAASGGAPSLNQVMASGGAPAEASSGAPAAEGHAVTPVLEAAPVEPQQSSTTETASAPASLNSLNALGAAQLGGGVIVPAVAPAVLARLPDQPTVADQTQALSNAPVKALIENVEGIGDLPKVGNNGAKPSTAYARPSDPSISLPKIAILIEGIGLSRQASLAAINKLPPEVSLVLSPYGRDLDDWVFRSRLAGHEVFMSLPMESEKFPLEDAGPLALDTRIQVAENKRRLDTVMASAGGYVGLVSYLGSRFLKAEGQIRELLKIANGRGLMFIIGGRKSRNDATQIAADLGIPRAETEFYLDETPSIQEIRTALDRAVSLAKDKGSVLVIARPYPVTLGSIVDWTKTIPDAGVALVPASAVATAGQ